MTKPRPTHAYRAKDGTLHRVIRITYPSKTTAESVVTVEEEDGTITKVLARELFRT